MKGLFAFIAWLGATALVAFAPFFGPFFGLHLIGEPFEVTANAVACALASIAGMLAWVLFRGVKTLYLKKVAAMISAAFAAQYFLVCLALTKTVDILWAPEMWTHVVQGFWFVAYECIFIGLSVCIACIYLLVPKDSLPSDDKKDDKPDAAAKSRKKKK